MAVPKRKVTRSRGNMRASHKSLKSRQLFNCPTCGQANRPHTVCINCGSYRSRVVVRHEDEAEA